MDTVCRTNLDFYCVNENWNLGVFFFFFRGDMILKMIRQKGGRMTVPCEQRALIFWCYCVSLLYDQFCPFSSCPPAPVSLSKTLTLSMMPPMDGGDEELRQDWRQTFKTRAVTINSSLQPSCWVCWELVLISYADTPNRWPWSYQESSRSHQTQQAIILLLHIFVGERQISLFICHCVQS